MKASFPGVNLESTSKVKKREEKNVVERLNPLKNTNFMDVRRFSRAVTTMKCTKKRDACAESLF